MVESKIEWSDKKPKEIESLIIELHKKSNTPEKIGLILRDKYGIPKTKKLIGKRISKIIKEAKEEIVPEKKGVQGKIEKLEKHIKLNKHDYPAKRSLNKKQWVIHSLSQ